MKIKLINLVVVSGISISSLIICSGIPRIASKAIAQITKIDTNSQHCVRQELPKLKQGMPYSKAREMLLEAGWQAIFNQDNFRNPERRSFLKYFINKGYDEIADCSGSGLGLCYFQFESAYGEILSVVTSNNFENQENLFRWYIEEKEPKE
ncbi:hypothetical protein PN465_22855 [Nodularia spumigena CS-584]|jgi:hypothetical protein|uniref:hypothetical protein n=1 Tax=Nodularia spumigena TaxID=70799 RepID=UPI0000EAD9D5|nr:hypothetical protein [Nodularia spumigena]AHJ27025.1 hypothetical protein NSP_6770 [Nodularia spumigena CCY9414]EAW47407.1 hypothetical protein N9414_21475 [Nodularia spumigena CCY9414]MDB9385029.1 hypothetical protein [Nodularia spumigena CS-584]